MGKNKGLFLNLTEDDAQMVRDLADKRGLTVTDMVIGMVKDSMDSTGEMVPRPTVDEAVVSSLVADAIRGSVGFLGDFSIERLGHQLAIRGVMESSLSVEDRKAVLEAYDGHARFWDHGAEVIHECFVKFVARWKGLDPSSMELSNEEVVKWVTAFYEFRAVKERVSGISKEISDGTLVVSKKILHGDLHGDENNPRIVEAIAERIAKGTLEGELIVPVHGVPITIAFKASRPERQGEGEKPRKKSWLDQEL